MQSDHNPVEGDDPAEGGGYASHDLESGQDGILCTSGGLALDKSKQFKQSKRNEDRTHGHKCKQFSSSC